MGFGCRPGEPLRRIVRALRLGGIGFGVARRLRIGLGRGLGSGFGFAMAREVGGLVWSVALGPDFRQDDGVGWDDGV